MVTMLQKNNSHYNLNLKNNEKTEITSCDNSVQGFCKEYFHNIA